MKTSKKLNSKQVIKYYWRHVRHYPVTLTAALFVLPLTILCNQILPALLIANILARLSKGQYQAQQPWQSFSHEILVYSGLILFGGLILWRLVDLLVWRLEGNIQRDIAQEVFDHLVDQSADFHATHFSGSLVSQSNKLVSAYVKMADTTFFSVIPLIASIVFTAIILAPRSPLFVALLILFSAIFVATAIFASHGVRKTGSKHAAAESKQIGLLADVIGNIMAVKSFSREKHESGFFKQATDHTHNELVGVMNAHRRQMIYFTLVSRTILVISLVMAIVSVVSLHTNIATTFLIINYTANIVDQLFNFSNGALRNYNRAVGDASDMVTILNQPAEIADPKHPEASKIIRGTIQFKDVTFKHKESREALFDTLSLRIKAGEKVGLVGHSGSGKTTLTKLLLRFTDIDSGHIFIDGQDITHITQNELRSHISYVPQEPLLFHRSIAENIAYGRPGASLKEIKAIARMANADEFISQLPKQYETLVGERGVKLSGGQRQRVAIARALLKNSPILLLDEATSALDSESEGLIQDALWKLMEGRTAIVIAHRLSTIQRMDWIIVLAEGKIVEQGTHKELIRLNGVYGSLWQHQSGGFLSED